MRRHQHVPRTAHSQHNKIGLTFLGGFQNRLGGLSHTARRYRSVLTYLRWDQSIELTQYLRGRLFFLGISLVFSGILLDVQQNQLCTVFFSKRNGIRHTSQRFRRKVRSVEDSMETRIRFFFAVGGWPDSQYRNRRTTELGHCENTKGRCPRRLALGHCFPL